MAIDHQDLIGRADIDDVEAMSARPMRSWWSMAMVTTPWEG